MSDFLFDTCYCTFFSAWYPGIAAADPWACSLATMAPDDTTDARHHCYELTSVPVTEVDTSRPKTSRTSESLSDGSARSCNGQNYL